MDFDVAEYIRQSNLIEGIDDPVEDAQSLVAWDNLAARPSLNHGVIRMTQRIIVANEDDLPPDYKGSYRDVLRLNVSVGNHEGTRWQRVWSAMDFWLELMPQRTPWVNHVGFETIHPFADGNGRTGRMLMWWQEVQAGQTPTLFKAADRQRYYADLSSTRLEDV